MAGGPLAVVKGIFGRKGKGRRAIDMEVVIRKVGYTSVTRPAVERLCVT